MTRHPVVIAALIAAAVSVTLAACSPTTPTSSPSAGAHRATSTPSATRSATPSVTATPTTGPAASNPPSTAHQLPASTPVNEADYEVPAFGANGPAFNSPSGNLHCGILRFGPGIDGGYWGCAADQHTWIFSSANPGDPCYNSEVNCGGGIEAEIGGPVGVLKAGDVQFPGTDPTDYPTKVLPYGKSVSYEGITCAVTTDGVTCIELASGHGFFISKTANDIF